MIKVCIEKLMQRKNLTIVEARTAVEEILSNADTEQVAAFMVLLHAKGETSEELLGIVQSMRSVMNAVHVEGKLIDLVGTGGDNANTVNISTAASLLVAACGAKVVKHGNRSVSSRCGSADVIEALGIRLENTPESVEEELNKRGFAFCYAPSFHPAMHAVKKIRQSLGVRTTFNLIGPLLNPANAQYYVMGVYKESLMDLFADTLIHLGVKRALIVHSCGLDELSLLGPSAVIEIKRDQKEFYEIYPQDYGFECGKLSDIRGGDPRHNASLIKNALSGGSGPITDTILLNAGAALYIYGLSDTILDGVNLARHALESGLAKDLIREAHA